ncbi:MAG: cytochrome c [Archangium sp.]|nr:cytochrome c [Archangium sp.]MDP3151718.1 cytochrome c [Archangium sp.]MDP3573236.1 cytochrome c [Archangium sp.]
MRTSLLLVAALALPAFAQGSIFPDPNTKKASKQLEWANVSEESKAFLKSKMKHHGKEMKDLSLAVATVRLAEVQRLAQDVANQPRLDATSGPAMKLPPMFFELQDDLRKNAQALSDAAKAKETDVLHARFSAVMENCMTCHVAFKK